MQCKIYVTLLEKEDKSSYLKFGLEKVPQVATRVLIVVQIAAGSPWNDILTF